MGSHLIDSHDKQNIMKAFAVLALLPFVACGPAHPVPAPHYGSYHQPAPYHAPAPAYGHHAPAYHQPAPHYGGYGYEEPKHNCTVQDVTEIADVCVPAFEVVCADVELAIKIIVDKEFNYQVTRTVCTESIDIIPNEVCSYAYQQKTEATTAKTVEVTFEKKEDVQMVTVCQPGHHGYGYGSYGHNYCKEVAQTTAYNVPRVTCEDIVEDRTITVPEVEDSIVLVEKCDTKLAAPACQKVELTLPKQVCVELVYGYAHEPEPAYAPAHPAPAAEA